MKLDRPLIVIDTETTGLHPARNQVLSLGMVFVNRELAKVGRMQWRINLENPSEVLRREYWRAQKVHKISLRTAIFGGEPLEDVVYQLEQIAGTHKDSLIAGNNVGFDYAFLSRMFDMEGKKNPFSYRTVDLTTLAAVHLGVYGGLKSTMQTLGLDPEGFTQHDALADADATASALIALLKILKAKDALIQQINESAKRSLEDIDQAISIVKRISGPGMDQGEVEKNRLQ